MRLAADQPQGSRSMTSSSMPMVQGFAVSHRVQRAQSRGSSSAIAVERRLPDISRKTTSPEVRSTRTETQRRSRGASVSQI